jgi:hypothetical protein
MFPLTFDWVIIYNLLALLGGIILGIELSNSHHHIHAEIEED